MKRTIVYSVLIAFLTAACHDATDLIGPEDALLAKGGKPGAPTEAEPKLEEFWVYSVPGVCEQMIHIVASGDFIRIGKNINHDHFFNAVRDDDPPVETHFEYAFGGPSSGETQFKEDGTIGHVDVCFDGVRSVERDADGNVEHVAEFVDYPSTSVDGTGVDPFAISPGVVTYQTSTTTGVRVFRPMGVVVGGDELTTTGPVNVTSAWHDDAPFASVRSYALHQGANPWGYIYYDALSMSDLSCSIATEKVRIDKVKTTVTTTTISANVTVGYAASGPNAELIEDFWGEGHFMVITDEDPDDDVPPDTTVSRRIMTPANDGTFSASIDVEGDWSGKTVLVNFFVDFLHTTGVGEDWPGHYAEVGNYVYDPGLNSNPTFAGIGGELWDGVNNVSKALGDGLFPVTYANTEAVPFTCQ